MDQSVWQGVVLSHKQKNCSLALVGNHLEMCLDKNTGPHHHIFTYFMDRSLEEKVIKKRLNYGVIPNDGVNDF